MLNRTNAIASGVFCLRVVLGVFKPYIRFQHRACKLLGVKVSDVLLGERLHVHGGGVLLDLWTLGRVKDWWFSACRGRHTSPRHKCRV